MNDNKLGYTVYVQQCMYNIYIYIFLYSYIFFYILNHKKYKNVVHTLLHVVGIT
jgi:hypothetical protein